MFRLLFYDCSTAAGFERGEDVVWSFEEVERQLGAFGFAVAGVFDDKWNYGHQCFGGVERVHVRVCCVRPSLRDGLDRCVWNHLRGQHAIDECVVGQLDARMDCHPEEYESNRGQHDRNNANKCRSIKESFASESVGSCHM